jgi:hypothetical protein
VNRPRREEGSNRHCWPIRTWLFGEPSLGFGHDDPSVTP